MTTKYTDWLSAVSAGTFNVNNVNLNVRLVIEDYIPDKAHKPADVDKYIITAVSTIVDNYFSSNGMGSITELTRERLKEGLLAFPDAVMVEIDRLITDPTKHENLKRVISGNPDPMREGMFWTDLKENGVKYLVFESVQHGCLCFCEEL